MRMHRMKLQSMRPAIDNKQPAKYQHLVHNMKRMQVEEGAHGAAREHGHLLRVRRARLPWRLAPAPRWAPRADFAESGTATCAAHNFSARWPSRQALAGRRRADARGGRTGLGWFRVAPGRAPRCAPRFRARESPPWVPNQDELSALRSPAARLRREGGSRGGIRRRQRRRAKTGPRRRPPCVARRPEGVGRAWAGGARPASAGGGAQRSGKGLEGGCIHQRAPAALGWTGGGPTYPVGACFYFLGARRVVAGFDAYGGLRNEKCRACLQGWPRTLTAGRAAACAPEYVHVALK